jgi:hypothetical protein
MPQRLKVFKSIQVLYLNVKVGELLNWLEISTG